jgi:hypothetical protein
LFIGGLEKEVMMNFTKYKWAGLVLLVALVMAAAVFADEPVETTEPTEITDEEGIRQAVMNYVNSVYEMKPELVDKSVHPKLQKVGFAPKKDEKGYREMWMTRDELRELAVHWNQDGSVDAATAKAEVKILAQLDQIAVVRLDAEWGIDFIQLAKIKGTWMIINVMWQTYPKE